MTRHASPTAMSQDKASGAFQLMQKVFKVTLLVRGKGKPLGWIVCTEMITPLIIKLQAESCMF